MYLITSDITIIFADSITWRLPDLFVRPCLKNCILDSKNKEIMRLLSLEVIITSK